MLSVAFGSMLLVTVTAPAFYYLLQQIRQRQEENEKAAQKAYVRARQRRD